MTDAGGEITLLRGAPTPWEPADPKTFSGSARVQRLGGAGEAPALRLFRVEFEPGGRTHWHEHTGTQLLIVVAGRCLVQRWGEPVQVAESGDVVFVAPGTKHWHGAGTESGAAHVAVNIDAETLWMEPAPPP